MADWGIKVPEVRTRSRFLLEERMAWYAGGGCSVFAVLEVVGAQDWWGSEQKSPVLAAFYVAGAGHCGGFGLAW